MSSRRSGSHVLAASLRDDGFGFACFRLGVERLSGAGLDSRSWCRSPAKRAWT